MGSSRSGSEALTVSSRRGGRSGVFGSLLISLFFLVFLALGSIVIWVGTVGPAVKVVEALTWKVTPCTVISSEVVGDDTYRIQIEYEYEFDGRKFTGDQYSFFNPKTSGKAGKEKIVQAYPPGRNTTCYVNAGAPHESVVNREVNLNILWGLFGVPFFLVGAGGFYFTWRTKPKTSSWDASPGFDTEAAESFERAARSNRAQILDRDFGDEDLREEPGPVTLSPSSSPLGSFLFMLIFALIWNGVILAISATRLSDWLAGKWEWMPEIILVPFLLVGLLLIFGVFHSFLGLFNPIPVLTMSRQMIPLGGTAVLSWTYRGSARSIRSVQVTLKGMEVARYTRGTDTHTDTSTFFEEVLFESHDTAQIESGQAEILVPTDTIHSFSGKNNQIKWQLNFRGDIPFWPDVTSEFPIRVVPHE